MTEKRSKLVLGLFLVSAVVVLALSLYTGISLNSVVDSLEQSRNQRLLAEAQAASLIVSADELTSIQDAESLNAEQTGSLQRRLSAFAALHSLTELTYIRQLPTGELQYIVSSSSGAGIYDVSVAPFASNGLIDQAFGGSLVVTDLTEASAEQGGLKAFSPVYDSQGTIVAVAAVGIDDTAAVHAGTMIRNLTVILLICIAIVILAACANVLLQVRKEQELQESVRVQRLMIQNSQNLASEQAFDERVNTTLEILGTYLKASRAYIINISDDVSERTIRQHWFANSEEGQLSASEIMQLHQAMRKTFIEDGIATGTPAAEIDTDTVIAQDTASEDGAKDRASVGTSTSETTAGLPDVHAVICTPRVDRATEPHINELREYTKGCVWAPLVVQNEIWGVLALDFAKPKKEIPDKDIQLTESATSDLVGAITRELYSEQREQALDHAVQASEAKSEFLSNMSHEMRTPMNAIIGMTSIALGTDDPERKDYCLDHIKDASAHLLTIINDVLDMSSLQSSTLTLRESSFDIHQVLDGVVKDHAHKIQSNNHAFSLEIDERIPSPLIGDNQRLAKVVSSLLSNAIKFTPDGGSVTVRVKHMGSSPSGHELRFEVEDTGIGLDPALRNNLFGSFEQADTGATRKYGGTGLGLAISRRIVELMNGQIGVESQVNKGSLFHFTVALKEDTENQGLKLASATGVHRAIKQVGTQATGNAVLQGKGADAVEVTAGAASSTPSSSAEVHDDDTTSNSGVFDIIEGVDDPPEIPDFSAYRIMLAEDIEINREVVLALLADTNIKIETTANGIEVFEAIKNDPGGYDLVFMDLQMPEMDGLDATRRIRALPNPELAGLPIIAMTANVFQEDIDACLEAGMNDHIGKPISLEAIYRILEVYLPAK